MIMSFGLQTPQLQHVRNKFERKWQQVVRQRQLNVTEQDSHKPLHQERKWATNQQTNQQKNNFWTNY